MKAKKPTTEQTIALRQIAGSRLIKTHLATRREPIWEIDGVREISHQLAQTLIRNGWVKANRDGLSMFDESQTYVALTP